MTSQPQEPAAPWSSSMRELRCRRQRLLEVPLQARTGCFILGSFYVAALQGHQHPCKSHRPGSPTEASGGRNLSAVPFAQAKPSTLLNKNRRAMTRRALTLLRCCVTGLVMCSNFWLATTTLLSLQKRKDNPQSERKQDQ